MLIQVNHPIWQKSKSSIVIQAGRCYNAALQLQFLKGQTVTEVFEWLMLRDQEFRIIFAKEDVEELKHPMIKSAEAIREITSAWPEDKHAVVEGDEEELTEWHCECIGNHCQMNAEPNRCAFKGRKIKAFS